MKQELPGSCRDRERANTLNALDALANLGRAVLGTLSFRLWLERQLAALPSSAPPAPSWPGCQPRPYDVQCMDADNQQGVRP